MEENQLDIEINNQLRLGNTLLFIIKILLIIAVFFLGACFGKFYSEYDGLTDEEKIIQLQIESLKLDIELKKQKLLDYETNL